MKLTKTFGRFSALVAVAAVLLLAHPVAGQGFKWWQDDEFKKELGLTPEQTRGLEEIFQKALPDQKALKTALDVAEAQFAKLIQRGDKTATMEQIDVVEAARSALNKGRSRMLVNMRQTLTSDQWARFTALHQATERDRAQAKEPK
jgi:Spy/CpxP family protein refolding chaperone